MNYRKTHLKKMLGAISVAAMAAVLFSGQAMAETVTKGGKKFVKVDGELFPALQALTPPGIPKDNPQSVDANGWPIWEDPKVQLGYKLFFEPALSGDGSVPCVTCHKPDEGWSLSSSISRGYPGISHWLNSQTILNTANLGKLFWDGHKLSLEAQAPSAAQGLSGNGKSDMMEQRLYQVPEYRKAFKAIFGSDRNMVKDSWRAIAAFERAMNTPETPFDQYMRGDKGALSADQVRGLKIFEGKGRCIMCHNGPLLTDEKYYNVGLPDQPQFWDDPIKQAGHRSQMYSRGQPEYMFRKTNTHPGVYLSTHLKQDIGKFRTAPLRHLEYTPPFMHNGMFDDLEAVIDFYNKGGDKDRTLRDYGIANKTKRLKKLDLTDGEKADLLAFLESLSGDEHLLPTPKLPAPAVMTATESTFSRK